MPWSARFDDPIPLPGGRKLVTLEHAGTYITKLPKAEHEAAEWQAAMEALILVATPGPTTSGYRISRRGSCAQLAASAAVECPGTDRRHGLPLRHCSRRNHRNALGLSFVRGLAPPAALGMVPSSETFAPGLGVSA